MKASHSFVCQAMECGGGTSLRNMEAEKQDNILIHSSLRQKKISNRRQYEGTQSLIALITLSMGDTWLSLAEMSPCKTGAGRQ